MTRHPDAGVLAECREGLLGRRRAARIRAHLGSCPHCASLDAGLAEVSHLLASSPAPSMPGHLIARLDRALAAEAASRPAAVQATPASPGDDVAGQVPGGPAAQPDGQPGSSARAGHGGRPGRRSVTPRHLARLRPATLGAAAAALIVVGGAAYGLASLTGQQGGASGSAARGPGEPRHSGALSPPNVGTNGPPDATPNPPGAGPADLTPASSLHVIHSATDYQPGTFASQAAAILASHPPSYSGQAQGTATPAMRTCVRQVTGGKTPQLVDVARYRGRPATIIVQGPSLGQPGKVWVTGAACSARRSDILAKRSLPGSG